MTEDYRNIFANVPNDAEKDTIVFRTSNVHIMLESGYLGKDENRALYNGYALVNHFMHLLYISTNQQFT